MELWDTISFGGLDTEVPQAKVSILGFRGLGVSRYLETLSSFREVQPRPFKIHFKYLIDEWSTVDPQAICLF